MASETRDPFLSDDEARIRGKQVIQWIENPNANDPPCPVSINTLTYQQVQDQSHDGMFRLANFVPGVQSDALKFPVGVESPRSYIQRYVGFDDETYYSLFFARGVIGLFDVKHPIGSPNPHPTDVALAFYSKEFGALDNLRFVFVYGVVNTQTVNFLNRHFEAQSIAQFGSPGMLKQYAYMYGTPEYEGILGVRIPRTIGYLVLGAFPRGNCRITRIEAYVSPGPSYHIRFDIEPTQ
ncbi:hypothetical protein N7528_001373 [Penicillium herquei]|nr:hypothetical protein N7528_001373 [Penicillium herquei]